MIIIAGLPVKNAALAGKEGHAGKFAKNLAVVETVKNEGMFPLKGHSRKGGAVSSVRQAPPVLP